MIDIHIIKGDQCDHLMTLHRGDKDDGPLQMVSAAKVAYWMQREVDYDALMARLEADDQLPGQAPERSPEG